MIYSNLSVPQPVDAHHVRALSPGSSSLPLDNLAGGPMPNPRHPLPLLLLPRLEPHQQPPERGPLARRQELLANARVVVFAAAHPAPRADVPPQLAGEPQLLASEGSVLVVTTNEPGARTGLLGRGRKRWLHIMSALPLL
jgi:hypothetical protein